jgi:hypothetical protein
MTIIELNTRFSDGANLDAAWKRGIGALQGGAPKDGAPERDISRPP